MRTTMVAVLVLFAALPGRGEIVTKTVAYTHGEATLEGYLAYDDAIVGKRAGVLVVHAWRGQDEYARHRTRQLAGLGYVAFAVDMYGKGIRPETNEAAATQAGIYRADRQLMRDRVTAGLEVLRSHELCDAGRVAAIGYCFGGGTVLELARSGAAIAGVVSFHGNLDTPDPSVAAHIRCKVLVCHGADDPHVPFKQVEAFLEEMRAAGVDCQFIAYGGAVHSFTDPDAGTDPSTGAAYHPDADRRSWEHMQLFFREVLE